MLAYDLEKKSILIVNHISKNKLYRSKTMVGIKNKN